MRHFLALFTLFFLGCIATATAAPPVQDDTQSAIITTDVSTTPTIHLSSSNIPDRDALPGIVITSNVNNTTAGSRYNQGAEKFLLKTYKNYEGGAIGTNTIKPNLAHNTAINFCLAAVG